MHATITQLGDSFAFRPVSSLRPSKHVRSNEELSWEEMLEAKNTMLLFMAKSGLWPREHAESIATFFLNLEVHPRRSQTNGKRALMVYQSRVRREWFDRLKNDRGFNISIIQNDLLRTYAEELNDTIRDKDNVARDREIDQARTLHHHPELGLHANSPLSPFFPALLFPVTCRPLCSFTPTPAICTPGRPHHPPTCTCHRLHPGHLHTRHSHPSLPLHPRLCTHPCQIGRAHV